MIYQITTNYFLAEDLLEWRFTTASGPGGQHVNRSQTAASVRFHAAAHLPPAVLERLGVQAGSRLDEQGFLTVQCQKHRSQFRNRTEAVENLVGLLREAFKEPRRRKKTRPSRSSKEKRLDNKKHRGKIKAERKKNWD